MKRSRYILSRRWLRRAALGLGLMSVAAATPAGQDVPQHWVSYAQLVSHQFQAWLSDDSTAATQRLHDWLAVQGSEEGHAPESLVVRVWVADDGRVERLEAASFGDPVIDEALLETLTARPLAEPPPKDMRQPLVLRLVLNLPPPADTEQS